MKMKIYSVRDRAVDQFGNPFPMIAHGQAIRAFSNDINGEKVDQNIKNHPEDFDLYYCGEFDTDTGRLIPAENAQQIAIGKDLKTPPER